MRIAVVIPAFNVAPWLCGAILSLLDQTHPDWSVVIVDDGSTDTTAEVAASYLDPRITLIRQDNAGVSAARNRGIEAHCALPAGPDRPFPGHDGIEASRIAPAKPDAFLFLDADDWLAPDALALLAEALESAPRAIAACGRYARIGASGLARLAAPPPQGRLLERLLIRNLFVNGGHLLIRREAIEAVGGFRPDLSYGEDWEFWTRLALRGEFVALPSPAPVLFVRERPGSAYLRMATDPAAYQPAMEAIHRNAALVEHLGAARLGYLRHRAEAEIAWTIGRELIRRGQNRDGRRWLSHSVRSAPSLKRLGLIGLSWLRTGPFRPHQAAA